MLWKKKHNRQSWKSGWKKTSYLWAVPNGSNTRGSSIHLPCHYAWELINNTLSNVSKITPRIVRIWRLSSASIVYDYEIPRKYCYWCWVFVYFWLTVCSQPWSAISNLSQHKIFIENKHIDLDLCRNVIMWYVWIVVMCYILGACSNPLSVNEKPQRRQQEHYIVWEAW